MASRNRRPGLVTIEHLSQELRTALQPVFDVLGRVTGQSLRKVSPIVEFTDPNTVTTPQLAEKVNEVIAKVNEVISRLQED